LRCGKVSSPFVEGLCDGGTKMMNGCSGGVEEEAAQAAVNVGFNID
jgi:hypothetical protein